MKLTDRRIEVLKQIASDCCTKEIAANLGISAKTVEFHRKDLYNLTGKKTVVGLTLWAIENGIIKVEVK